MPNPFHRRLPQQRVTAAVLGLLGFGCAALALQMPLGTPTRMGPGFLPLLFGVALSMLALWLGLAGPACGQAAPERPPLRPGLTVLGVIVLFAWGIDHQGGLIAAAMLGAFCALAFGMAPGRAFLAGAALGVGVLLLFVHGLGVPIPLTPRATATSL